MALFRAAFFRPLQVQGEIDHQDRVFHHNADQQDDADQGDRAGVGVAQLQYCSSTRRRREASKKSLWDGCNFLQHAKTDIPSPTREISSSSFCSGIQSM